MNRSKTNNQKNGGKEKSKVKAYQVQYKKKELLLKKVKIVKKKKVVNQFAMYSMPFKE
jgi:hypothetical protein